MVIRRGILLFIGISSLFSCGDDPSYMHDYRDGNILIPFQKEGSSKWGFVNYDGEVVVEPVLSIRPSHAVNGLSLVVDYKKREEIYYFVQVKDGKLQYPGKHYDLAGEFKDGLAPVRDKNSRIQFINTSFKTVFTAEAAEVGYFNEGLAAFKDFNGKWGFINSSGKVVISAQYDKFLHGFSGGYAAVMNALEDEEETIIIDKSGKVHSRYKLNVLDVKIREGKIGLITDEGCGYFTPSGSKLVGINTDWELITPFFNGYASFMEGYNWGLIDSTGSIVLPSDYEKPIYVSEDRAWVCSDDYRRRQWTIKYLGDLSAPGKWMKLKGIPYPFMCGKSLVNTKYQSSFLDYSSESISESIGKKVASFNPKYYPGFAWNETFKSTAFEEEIILNEIPISVFQDTTILQWVNAFEISDEELFGSTDDFETSYKSDEYMIYSSNRFVTRTWYNHGNYSEANKYDYLRYIDEYEDYYEEAEDFAATVEPDFDIPDHSYLNAPFGVRSAVMELEFDAPYISDMNGDYYYYGGYEKVFASTDYMSTAERMKFRRLSDQEQYDALTINPKASFNGYSYTLTLLDEYEHNVIQMARKISLKAKPFISGELAESDSSDKYLASGTLKNGMQFRIRTRGGSIFVYVTRFENDLFEYYWEDDLEQIVPPIAIEDDF